MFLAREPISSRKLSQYANLADGTEARTLVRRLNERLEQFERAFEIREVASGFVLTTRSEFAKWIRRLDYVPSQERLSTPSMETLAVIAYRQPVMRAEIEAVRGVSCGEVLNQLMSRDLVRVGGRSDDLGRPYLYNTTRRFLQMFGLRSLDDLPSVKALPSTQGNTSVLSAATDEVASPTNVSFTSEIDSEVEEELDVNALVEANNRLQNDAETEWENDTLISHQLECQSEDDDEYDDDFDDEYEDDDDEGEEEEEEDEEEEEEYDDEEYEDEEDEEEYEDEEEFEEEEGDEEEELDDEEFEDEEEDDEEYEDEDEEEEDSDEEEDWEEVEEEEEEEEEEWDDDDWDEEEDEEWADDEDED